MVDGGRDVETRLIIEAHMKGGQRIVQEAGKIKTALGTDKLARGMKDFDKALESVRRNLESTVKEVKDFDARIKGLAGSGSALRTLTQLMQQFRQQAEGAAAATDKISAGRPGGAAPRARAPRRGGFAASMFGAGRQGMLAGGAAGGGRIGAGGAGMATGFGRLLGGGAAAAAAGGATLVGAAAIGGVAGLSRLALQSSQEALQSRVLLQDLMGATAGGQLTAETLSPLVREQLNRRTLGMNEQALEQFRNERAVLLGRGVSPGGGLQDIRFTETGGRTGGAALARPDIMGGREDPRVGRLNAMIADLEESNRFAQKFLSPEFRRQQQYETGQERLRALARQAGPLGFTIPQAIQLQTQSLTRAGIEAFTPQGMQLQQQTLQMARLGLDPSATGGIGLGGRLGAFGQAGGGAVMESVFANAVESGLNQAEINRFMQSMATNVELFRQTGIPIASDSVLSLGRMFVQGGVGTMERGVAAGGGFIQFLQRLSSEGPRRGSRLGFVALRQFADLPDNPTPEQLENALIRMQDLISDPAKAGELAERFPGFLRTLIRGAGGGAGGRLTAAAELRGEGIRFGRREFRGVGQAAEFGPEEALRGVQDPQDRLRILRGLRQLRGGQLTGKLQEQLIQLEGQRAQLAGEDPRFTTAIGARAAGVTDVAAQRAAQQTNARIVATSASVLAAAQNFADVQVSAVTGTAKVLGDRLEALSGAVADAVDAIKEKIEELTDTGEAQ